MAASSPFDIIEHKVECQHIREYARATSCSQEEVLHLAVKQYVPKDNRRPQEGDITIIGAHANGFPKELYEPLWEDLYSRSKDHSFRIRSIWIADVAHQGESGIINENALGNDPSWMDHTRDLLHMINQFRAEMPMPIVGIGHSFGAVILCNLAIIHPRLLSTLVMMDPALAIESDPPAKVSEALPITRLSAIRRDLWPSRAEAEAAFRKSKFYQGWDPRVLNQWCKYGIRETPSALYPNERGSVTLSTTKHQECFTFARPSWDGLAEDGQTVVNRDLVPDLNPETRIKHPIYRAESVQIATKFPEVRPSVQYIFGETSSVCFPEARTRLSSTTGTGIGGSGGPKEDRVKAHVVKGIGHLVAMEATGECADVAASWLGREVKRMEKERKEYLEWTKQSLIAKSTMSEGWKKWVGVRQTKM